MASELASRQDFGEVLTDSNIAQFLASQSWICQQDRTFDQVWTPPTAPGERIVPILLPRDKTFVDYDRRIVEAINAIGRVYDWSVSKLAEQIASIHADLFFVRVDQYMQDGTIPLRQATSLLENIEQMVRASAVTAYNPAASGRGRLPAAVKDFLDDDVRMGHTKRGSFIITVAARIEPLAAIGGAEPAAASRNESSATGDPEMDPPTAEPESFTRQVMTTLATSLHHVRDYVTNDQDVDFDQAVNEGMRLPMVQALNGMARADGLRALDLSFEWAAAEPKRLSDIPDEIIIESPALASLPQLTERLRRQPESEQQTIVGPVTELKRGDQSSTDEAGEIVVRADVNGRWRRVTVPLFGRDYDLAIRAHRARLPFTATGTLERKSNSWRLIDPIEVDRSFLEHELGSR